MHNETKPEGRFFLAIAMTFAFLFVWFNFFAPKPAVKEATEKTDAQVQGIAEGSAQSASANKNVQASAISEDMSLSTFNEEEVVQSYDAWTESFSTPLLSLKLSNQGGGLVSVSSMQHKKIKDGEEGVELLKQTPSFKLPVSWIHEIDSKRIDDSLLSYAHETQGTTGLVFSTDLGQGISLKKSYVWDENSYKIKHKVSLINASGKDVKLSSSLRLSSQQTGKAQSKFAMFSPPLNKVSAVAYIGDSSSRWPIDKMGTAEDPADVPTGGIEWFGFEKQYFLISAVPVQKRWESLQVLQAAAEKEGELLATYPSWNMKPGEQQDYEVELFVGPKDIEILEKAKAGMEQAIDLGSWLGPIARPILKFLKWLYSIFPNYGVAIILLTFLVRLMMFPLTQMQAKSMKKMSLHKPQMDALKEQYKDDREAHSRELMTYMRKNKINPAGGCFLLILQMPIFFALYRVLYNSIELRHAPFMLWIKDLSAHDPMFVLPVLLGIAMFFQQKLTPTAGVDPAQQAMMKFIPIMFTAFMIFLPAGLNIYILVSTLWGVAQQYWIQKSVHAPVVSA